MFEELWSGISQNTKSWEIVALLNESIQHGETTSNEMISTAGRGRKEEGRERERRRGEGGGAGKEEREERAVKAPQLRGMHSRPFKRNFVVLS